MADEEWRGPERRAYPRIEVAFGIQLRVELTTSTLMKLEGHTINLSRGGMLAKVDQRVALLARCRVRFLDAEDRLRPTKTSGVVRRVHVREDGFAIAVQFDEPLEELRVVPTGWPKKKIDL